jgi:hypothetical protein
VAARLDLSISQSLLDRNFKLSIIKRCWEDQLRLKRKMKRRYLLASRVTKAYFDFLDEDFVSDSDLLMACTILQKQIEHIDGKKDNITVPSVAMKRIREKEQAGNLSRSRINVDVCMNDIVEAHAREQAVSGSSSTNPSDGNDVEMTTSSTESNSTEANTRVPTSSMEEIKNAANPCVLCLMEEKRLACIPCGHLATCVPCGHSLRSCPICRREIDAFMRIYI